MLYITICDSEYDKQIVRLTKVYIQQISRWVYLSILAHLSAKFQARQEFAKSTRHLLQTTLSHLIVMQFVNLYMSEEEAQGHPELK